MKWLVIALVAVGGFFAWKHFMADKPAELPAASDPTRTAGGNVNNRMNNLSGVAPDPDAR